MFVCAACAVMYCNCSLYNTIYSFFQAISIAPLQVHYYSEALPTEHGYFIGVSCRNATISCELRTCPRSLHGSRSNPRSFERKVLNLPMSLHAPHNTTMFDTVQLCFILH